MTAKDELTDPASMPDPGPWHVAAEPPTGNRAILPLDGSLVAWAVYSVHMHGSARDGRDTDGNARLIAAAPEMYELLVKVRRSGILAREFRRYPLEHIEALVQLGTAAQDLLARIEARDDLADTDAATEQAAAEAAEKESDADGKR